MKKKHRECTEGYKEHLDRENRDRRRKIEADRRRSAKHGDFTLLHWSK